jgi:Ca-activated chloride channel family protein
MHPFLLIALTDGLTFGSPAWIWALLLLGPLGWFFIEANRKRGVLLSKILAPRLQSQLAGRVSPLKRNLRMVSLLGAIACVILGLAKPRLGYRELEIKSKGRDVIIAIDTSRSMLSTDTVPTRLGRAKLIAQDLLTLLKGDRVGLIAFAGNAFLQAPLTLDKGAVLTSLEDLDTNTIPKGGTDIASAIRMAMEAFGKGEGSSRALVLMTDGEELEASAVAAAKEASAAGVRIFTIGFGSPAGSLIPITSDSGQHDFVRDDGGRPVTSKMDASRLTEVAKETGGFYQPYGQDAAKIIYEKGIVPIEEQERGMLSSRKPIERYAWPAGAALLFLTFWSLLGEGRVRFGGGGGRGLRTREAVAFIALALGFSPGALSASGLSDYRQGNYQGALKDFERRLQSGATAAEIKFDAGAAAYKAGDFKKAAGYFSEAMTSEKQKIKEAATYNLANALVRSGEAAQESEAKLSEWKNALQHYETVLKASPANARAQENRDIVLKLIEDQKKKQDQKKDKKDQKKDQDKKDKDQQKQEQSQDGGEGQKDSKGQDDQKDQNKDQQQKSDQQKGGENGKDQQKQDQPKNGQGASQGQKDSQNQKQQGQASPTPSPSASPKEDGKGDNKGDQGPEQQQGQQGNQGGQPTPAPSALPKKEGSLGGGEQGEKKEQQGEEGSVAEAEEGKDGKMSANQARALLRSVQDEEQHVLNQQHRAVEQTLRDW